MKAVAKKQSTHDLHKKKRDTSHETLKGSPAINSGSQSPAVQLKPVCPCDGGCPRCAGVIQPKLIIGQPNDRYEQEADRVAEQVMRMPENTGVREQGFGVRERDESVQRKPT
ncbi:MAG: hypothetical protein ACUBOA_10585 [Candidatus Loosdrechtia sp.]|uniref:hypothetical protein n=1 Tax=Candidatus Loosdrechtia sp. TaxID=3101272 RepID=UPI003A706413|nr:MAG: hypothetical protein QY305_06015 [Candidatus Jettenia sp. AMX2]